MARYMVLFLHVGFTALVLDGRKRHFVLDRILVALASVKRTCTENDVTYKQRVTMWAWLVFVVGKFDCDLSTGLNMGQKHSVFIRKGECLW